jgi:methionyl-tRNA synthetase
VPRFASAVLSVLGVPDSRWEDIDRSIGGSKLGEERVLLERIDVGEIRGRVERDKRCVEERVEEIEGTVSFSDFEKVDLRVGVIVSASEVVGADRLLQLSVDFGDRTRSCVAGIKGSYAPDDLVGKRVVAVVNLEPRTIRGLQSECMLLAAQGEELSLVVVDKPMEPGTAVS